MNFIKLNKPTDNKCRFISKCLVCQTKCSFLLFKTAFSLSVGDKYCLVLEDVFENFYIGGEVTISLNNGDYKITNIDTTNIGMLTDI